MAQRDKTRPAAETRHRRAEALTSRHIFLDTQVYRALGHNPANRAMTLLKEQIDSHHVVLHVTDITLLEVERQIRERVIARQRDIGAIEADLVRWRKSAPKSAPQSMPEFDAVTLGTELFRQFEYFVRYDCGAQIHRALQVTPEAVFKTYFDRRPPFDGEESKEFPDGFVIEVLSQWCAQHGNQLYVVTEDKAMMRAVAADPRLLPLKDIHEVLARAAADLGAEGEAAAEAVFANPAFDDSFVAALKAQMGDMTYVYVGDLADGEAYEGKLLGVEEVGDWSVVGLNDQTINLVLDVRLRVRVEVQYENRDEAMYDREDDRWIGAETASTEVEDEIDVEVLVEVERISGIAREAKVLTGEVLINGPSDFDY